MNELTIDPFIEEEQKAVKRIIVGSQESGSSLRRLNSSTLYSVVLDKLTGNTRNTPEQITYLSAYEIAAAVFRASALELRKCMDILTLEQSLAAQRKVIEEMPQIKNQMQPGFFQGSQSAEKDKTIETAVLQELQTKISDGIFFSNRFALHFAGYVGLALLGEEKADIKKMFSFGTLHDASKERDELTKQLAAAAAADVLGICASLEKEKRTLDDSVLKDTFQAIFTTWVQQFQWNTFSPTAEKFSVQDIKLSYKGFSLSQGEFKQKHDEVIVDERIMPVRREDVIGSQEFGKVLWNNFLKLSAYDHERRKNPYDPASVIFTYGEPGGGKTFTSHAHIQSFADICKARGISFWAFTHSTTDYASHYQNKTANELSSLAEKVRSFPGIVVMYVADADNIFQSRKDPRLSSEQQQTLSVYFKMFDGTFIPKNGKFMAIMDANYIEGIDDATKSRLFDEVTELKRFSTAEDFSELVKRTISNGLPLKISDEDWQAVGKYVLETPLSNREVGHVVKKIRRNFTVPEEMLGASFEEHVKYRNEQLASLTKEGIISTFDDYIKNRMEIERASYESMRKDDTDRFLSFLNIEKPGTD